MATVTTYLQLSISENKLIYNETHSASVCSIGALFLFFYTFCFVHIIILSNFAAIIHIINLKSKMLMSFFTSMKTIVVALFLMVGSTAIAENVTVTFDATEDKGAISDYNNHAADNVEKQGVTIAVTDGLLGNGSEYRCYKSATFTVTSTVGNITKVMITCTANGSTKWGPGCFTTESGVYTFESDGKSGALKCDAASVTLTASENQVRMTKVVVTIGEGSGDEGGGGNVDPDPVTTDVIYEKTLVNDEGGFYAQDVTIPEGVTYVWKNNSYGWVASAYVNNQAYASESWLISPAFTLESDAKLTFDQALNKGTADAVGLYVTEDLNTLTPVAIPTMPAGNNWTFVSSGEIDLTAYNGKTIYLVFKYASTAENAPSWEIKNFKLTGKGTVAVKEPEPKAAYDNIAEAKANATAEEVLVSINVENLLVTYVNGKNIYVTDGSNGFLLFGDAEAKPKAGDKLSGKVIGKLYLYHALPELSITDSKEMTVASSNNEVVAPVVELGDVTGNPGQYTSMLVTFDGFNFLATTLADRKVTLWQDGNEIILYDQFNILTTSEFDTEKDYTATFIVTVRDDVVQVYPIFKSEFEEPYTFVGDGTQEKPYTVADAQHLFDANNASEPVWVKGFIIGSANSKIDNIYPLVEGVEAQASNLLLADAATETVGSKCLPVNLISRSVVREKLNIVDNTDMIGKEVLLHGTIEKYFGVAGMKNTDNAVVDGVELALNIHTVNADAVRAQGIYTVAGQRVNNVTRRGLYIVGGKKVLVK